MTRPPLVLGLDAGGSGLKWSLVRDAKALASGVTPPVTAAGLETPAGAEALSALSAALPGRPEYVHAGVTGLGQRPEQVEAARAALAGTLGLDPARVSVEGDLDLAYRAHLSPGAGVLLYAGTGSIAYHVAKDGTVGRAGGRGYRLGDDGGGFSLGRAAVRWLTDTQEAGGEPSGPLAAELAGVMGGLDWDTVRHYVYGTPGAAALARLAPAVGRAADAGDPVARGLLDAAAASLAELVARVRGRVGALPVTATGGAFRISPLFAAALGRVVPGVSVQHRDHAEAAARYAQSRLGGY